MYAGNASIDVSMSDLIEAKLDNINQIVDGKTDTIFKELNRKLN
jgi:hypothetical protein